MSEKALRISKGVAAAGVVLLLLGASWAGVAAGGSQAQGGAVARRASAESQLEHAKRVHASARGLAGIARLRALTRALEAYGAVGLHWPAPGPAAAEAAFRRGAIHRSLGAVGAARGAFLEAWDAGSGTPFAVRARLELGHLRRRAGELGAALAEYRAAQEHPGAALRYRNDAREWIGKVRLDLGEWEAAARAFAEWAGCAEGPAEIVRAVDLKARAWAGAGLVEAAEAEIARLRFEMQPLTIEPMEEAADLRRALEAMKAPRAIRAAKRAQRAKKP